MKKAIAVSIPFKREGACKVAEANGKRGIASAFQFPSNGKVHAKLWVFLPETHPMTMVSIPFKREGACKVVFCPIGDIGIRVSIPFKREGACKVITRTRWWER